MDKSLHRFALKISLTLTGNNIYLTKMNISLDLHILECEKIKYGFKFESDTSLKSLNTNDMVKCAKACEGETACVAWNYEGTKCTLLDSYSALVQSDGIVSGRHHTCLGMI